MTPLLAASENTAVRSVIKAQVYMSSTPTLETATHSVSKENTFLSDELSKLGVTPA